LTTFYQFVSTLKKIPDVLSIFIEIFSIFYCHSYSNQYTTFIKKGFYDDKSFRIWGAGSTKIFHLQFKVGLYKNFTMAVFGSSLNIKDGDLRCWINKDFLSAIQNMNVKMAVFGST